MPVPTNLPGWQRLTASEAIAAGKKPSSKPYLDPNGNVVAYNQFLKAQAQREGFTSYDAVVKFRKTHGVDIRREMRKGGEWQLGDRTLGLYRDVYFAPDGRPLKATEIDHSPGSPLARYLENLGIRPRNAPWNVGDTPKE